jgi:hypothetical protein
MPGSVLLEAASGRGLPPPAVAAAIRIPKFHGGSCASEPASYAILVLVIFICSGVDLEQPRSGDRAGRRRPGDRGALPRGGAGGVAVAPPIEADPRPPRRWEPWPSSASPQRTARRAAAMRDGGVAAAAAMRGGGGVRQK